MKKIFLLIAILLVTTTGWAQHNYDGGKMTYTLNPYAYDLSSSWDSLARKLTVNFKLNSVPNLDDGDYGDKGKIAYNPQADNEPNGIQIYAVDPATSKEYRIAGPGRDVIKKGTEDGYYQVVIDLSSGNSTRGTNDPLPKNTPLTWKVRVKGRKQQDANQNHASRVDENYSIPRFVNVSLDKLPYNATGIAVSANPYAPNFANIYVANAHNGSGLTGDYSWLNQTLLQSDWVNIPNPSNTTQLVNASRTPALLEYTAQLKYDARHRKNYQDGVRSWYSSAEFEPHRVRVSEDGRVFVSSYLPGAGWAVGEVVGGDSIVTIVKCDSEANNDNVSTPVAINSKYNRRAVDFDVKGSGEDLKILVAWVKPKGTLKSNLWYAKIECYEYLLGQAEKAGLTQLDQIVGMSDQKLANNLSRQYVKKVAEYDDYNPDANYAGFIFQGYAGANWAGNGSYVAGQYGFVGVSYGQGDNNPIWLKVDFAMNYTDKARAHILYFNDNGTDSEKIAYKHRVFVPTGYCSSRGFYGGHAITVTDDWVITADGRNDPGSGKHKHILFFNVSDIVGKSREITSLSPTKAIHIPDCSRPLEYITGLSLDYANNLYIVTAQTNRVYMMSLPYPGMKETPAPEGNTFVLPTDKGEIDGAVANIYPSKMRYVPAPVNDKYNFSFYANTKPKYAEIRFYRTQEDMKASMATVNDDNFQGDIESSKTDKLYCAYRIPNPKQGLNTVTLAMLGGEIGNDKYLTSAALPAGELYWSVYLETDRSSAFAPIYRQSNSGNDAHHTLHATINNYPETDQFGTIYATSENGTDMKLMQYEINDSGSDEYSLDNTSRYSLTATYPYTSLLNTHPRRMDVDADGMLYIAHEGYIQGYTEGIKYETVPMFKEGGIYMWNPKTAVDGADVELAEFSYNGIGTSSAVVLHNHPTDGWRVFAPNTYNEYKLHLKNETTGYKEEEQNDKYGWNGFVEYKKNNYPNSWTWIDYTSEDQNWSAKRWALKQGDASGNISLVAMDKGLWICQHREHSLAIKNAIGQSPADNPTAYVLRFVPYNSTQPEVRTWRSCTGSSGSNNSQTGSAPIQATPGAGIAWRKINGEDYLFIINQDGNIVREKLEWKKSATYNQDEPRFYLDNEHLAIIATPEATKGVITVTLDTKVAYWKTAAISSMCFDYAGNLITTTGVCYESKDEYYVGSSYPTGDQLGTPKDAQNIIVYTMPYNRTNAREIQAPNSCVRIAERLAYTEDADAMATKVVENKTTYIDLYRPMSNSSFSTICLPFDYDLSKLVEGDPYYKAKVRAFVGVGLSTIGGEKILELQFGDPVTSIEANIPYIIQPENNITGIVQIKQQVTLTNTSGESTDKTFHDGEKENSITFQGVIPMTEIPGGAGTNNLILVADNRLATVSASGPMYGFRAYFQLAKALPKGLKTKLGNKDNTVTGLIDVDGQKVNVEKFIREGRVYIRVGETLYTITGEVVGR